MITVSPLLQEKEGGMTFECCRLEKINPVIVLVIIGLGALHPFLKRPQPMGINEALLSRARFHCAGD